MNFYKSYFIKDRYTYIRIWLKSLLTLKLMLKINLYTNINNNYLNILSKSVLHIFPIDYIDKTLKLN